MRLFGQNNLELHLGCHTCWLSYFTLVCLWCGRTVGRSVGRCTVTWLLNFLGWVVYHIFLPMVLRCGRFAPESSAINPDNSNFFSISLAWRFELSGVDCIYKSSFCLNSLVYPYLHCCECPDGAHLNCLIIVLNKRANKNNFQEYLWCTYRSFHYELTNSMIWGYYQTSNR